MTDIPLKLAPEALTSDVYQQILSDAYEKLKIDPRSRLVKAEHERVLERISVDIQVSNKRVFETTAADRLSLELQFLSRHTHQQSDKLKTPDLCFKEFEKFVVDKKHLFMEDRPRGVLSSIETIFAGLLIDPKTSQDSEDSEVEVPVEEPAKISLKLPKMSPFVLRQMLDQSAQSEISKQCDTSIGTLADDTFSTEESELEIITTLPEYIDEVPATAKKAPEKPQLSSEHSEHGPPCYSTKELDINSNKFDIPPPSPSVVLKEVEKNAFASIVDDHEDSDGFIKVTYGKGRKAKTLALKQPKAKDPPTITPANTPSGTPRNPQPTSTTAKTKPRTKEPSKGTKRKKKSHKEKKADTKTDSEIDILKKDVNVASAPSKRKNQSPRRSSNRWKGFVDSTETKVAASLQELFISDGKNDESISMGEAGIVKREEKQPQLFTDSQDSLKSVASNHTALEGPTQKQDTSAGSVTPKAVKEKQETEKEQESSTGQVEQSETSLEGTESEIKFKPVTLLEVLYQNKVPPSSSGSGVSGARRMLKEETSELETTLGSTNEKDEADHDSNNLARTRTINSPELLNPKSTESKSTGLDSNSASEEPSTDIKTILLDSSFVQYSKPPESKRFSNSIRSQEPKSFNMSQKHQQQQQQQHNSSSVGPPLLFAPIQHQSIGAPLSQPGSYYDYNSYTMNFTQPVPFNPYGSPIQYQYPFQTTSQQSNFLSVQPTPSVINRDENVKPGRDDVSVDSSVDSKLPAEFKGLSHGNAGLAKYYYQNNNSKSRNEVSVSSMTGKPLSSNVSTIGSLNAQEPLTASAASGLNSQTQGLPLAGTGLIKSLDFRTLQDKERLEELALLVKSFYPKMKSLPGSPSLPNLPQEEKVKSRLLLSENSPMGEPFNYQYDYDQEYDKIDSELNVAALRKLVILLQEWEKSHVPLRGTAQQVSDQPLIDGEGFWGFWRQIFKDCIGRQMTRELRKQIVVTMDTIKAVESYIKKSAQILCFSEFFIREILEKKIHFSTHLLFDKSVVAPAIFNFHYRRLNVFDSHSQVPKSSYEATNYHNQPMNESIQEMWYEWLYGFYFQIPLRNMEYNSYMLLPKNTRAKKRAPYRPLCPLRFRVVKFIAYMRYQCGFPPQVTVDFLDSIITLNSRSAEWLLRNIDLVSDFIFDCKVDDLQISVERIFKLDIYNLTDWDLKIGGYLPVKEKPKYITDTKRGRKISRMNNGLYKQASN